MTTDRFHYDSYPFQFLDARDVGELESSHPELLRRTVASLAPGQLVFDLGSGPGRFSVWAKRRGLRVVALDLSMVSLARLRCVSADTGVVVADVLRLPLKARAHLVVLDGVAHHTADPFRALAEAVGAAQPGALVYFAVYKRFRYYPLLYWTIGALVRAANQAHRPGLRWITDTAFALYSLAHTLLRGRKDPEAMRNLFADYLLTPRATFHTRREVRGWAKRLNLREVAYDRHGRGNCHLFLFERPGAAEGIR